MKAPTAVGVISNILQTLGKKLNLAGSIEYVFTKNFSTGIGLDYVWNKDKRNNSILLNGTSTSLIQNENMNIKQTIFLPNIYITHHYKIIEKLYISTSLTIGSGMIKTEYNTSILYSSSTNSESSTFVPLSNESETEHLTMEDNKDSNLSAISLSPKINYFAFKRIGFHLSLGGLEYSLIDWETDNSTYGISFSPNYWKLGINITLQTNHTH